MRQNKKIVDLNRSDQNIYSKCHEICFAICLGIYGLKVDNFSIVKTVGLALYILITLIQLLATLFISIIASLKNITLKLKENEYSAVYEGLRLKNTFSKQYTSQLQFKKLFFMISLVLLYNEPLFQIINIIIIQVSQLQFSIIIKPVENKTERLKQVICDAFILIAEIQLLILIIDDYQSLLLYENRRIFGWICIFALVIIILCQLLFDAYSQPLYYHKHYVTVRKCVKWFKNICNSQQGEQTHNRNLMI